MNTVFDDLSRAILMPRKPSRRAVAIAVAATVMLAAVVASYQIWTLATAETVRAGVCYFAECAS